MVNVIGEPGLSVIEDLLHIGSCDEGVSHGDLEL
jgi:hypothetical protein